jgi:hydrogenase maturation protease
MFKLSVPKGPSSTRWPAIDGPPDAMPTRSRPDSDLLADLLVIGYGNTLRSDDGVGPRVAEAVEALRLPRVWTLSLPQLSPEHGECLARVREAVFVDASIDGSVDAPGEVHLRPLEPATSARVNAHAVSAATLLAISRDIFGRAPRAWSLTVPGSDFTFGEKLSPPVAAAVQKAVARIVAFTQGERES